MNKKFIINTTAGGLDVKVINENAVGDSREDTIIYCIKTDKCRSMHMTADSVIIECASSNNGHKDDSSEDMDGDNNEGEDSLSSPWDDADFDDDDYSDEDFDDECSDEDFDDNKEDSLDDIKDSKSESIRFTGFRPKKFIWGEYRMACEPTISLVKYNLLDNLTDNEKWFISNCIHNAYYRASLIDCSNSYFGAIKQYLINSDKYNKFDSIINSTALLIKFSDKNENDIKYIKDSIHTIVELLRGMNPVFNSKSIEQDISNNASSNRINSATEMNKSVCDTAHSDIDKNESSDDSNSKSLKSSYDTVRDMLDFISGTAKVIEGIVNKTSDKDTESTCDSSPCSSCKSTCDSSSCTSCKSDNCSSSCSECESNCGLRTCKSNNCSSSCSSCKDSCKESKSPSKVSRHKSIDCSNTAAKRFSESVKYRSTFRTKAPKGVTSADKIHSKMKTIHPDRHTSPKLSVNSSDYLERVFKDIDEIISLFTELDG